MGENAIRKSDNTEVKIGTCENMYYLRYEDRHKVRPIKNNVDPVREAESLRFRLPFPDEDAVSIGEYEDFNRGQRLYLNGPISHNDEFRDESTVSDPGMIQLTHASGLLLSVPCYHGIKLPDVTAPMKVFWNSKSWFLELFQLRPTPNGVKPIIRCRHCRNTWRYDWSDIWDYVPGDGLRAALRSYMEAETTMLVKKA
jgi:hypothetical protein